MLKTVIFDMDGTLVDSEPIYYYLENIYFKNLGLNISEEEHRSFKGMSGEGMWKLIKQRYEIPQTVEELVMTGRKNGLKKLAEIDLKPIDGVEDLIQDLLKNDVRLVLGTSASRARMELILSLLKFEKYFDVRVCVADVENAKPAPDIFLRAAELVSAEPQHCAVIEDSRNGLLAAISAGMKCVGYDNSEIRQDLSIADLVVQDFRTLNHQKVAGLFA